MSPSELLQEISRKETDKKEIEDRVASSPGLLPEIVEGLGADEARTRYGWDRPSNHLTGFLTRLRTGSR